MSASREKKQRQGSGPSEKANQLQQEQAERKRKTILYSIIGAVVVVLVAALLIWNTGFFQARATAATVGGTNISVADMSYYYYRARSDVAYYSQWGLYSFDSSIPDDEQFYNEEEQTTWRDYFMETALDQATYYTVLYNAAVADGRSVSEVRDDVNAQIESMKSSASSNNTSYATYLRAVYGEYMSAGSFKDLMGRILLASQYYNDHGDQLAKGYTQEDLEAYYTENTDSVDTFEYSYLHFSPETVEDKDADGNDLPEEEVTAKKELALAEAKTKVDEAQAAYKDGASIADLISQYSPSSSADHTTAVGSSAVYSKEILDLGEDESAVVEGSNGYDLVVFHSRGRDERPIANVRHILVQAETSTAEDGSTAAPTEETWTAAQQKAQSILDEYAAGAQGADAFGALANKYSDDPGSNTTGGVYSDITRNSSYVTEFKDWIFEDGRQAGDTGLVRHDGGTSGYSGYHVMYLDSFGEAEWAYSVRNTLANQQTIEWEESLEAGNEAVAAKGADYFGH